jgi:hypothetical protein
VSPVPVDIIGIVLASIGFVATTILLYVNMYNYQKLKTGFFKTGILMTLAFFLWMSSYGVMSFFNSPEYVELVRFSAAMAATGGLTGVAFLTSSMEYLKETPNRTVMAVATYGAGLLSALHFNGDIYTVVWTGFTWSISQSLIIKVLMGIYFTILMISVLPIPIRVWIRAREVSRFDRRVRALLALAIISCTWALFSIVVGTFFPPIFDPIFFLLRHRTSFVVYLSVFLLSMAILHEEHPTILFSSIPDLGGIHLVIRESGVPIYSFDFTTRQSEIGADLFSMAFIGIRHVLMEALNSTGKLRAISTGEHVVLVYEGDLVMGFLVTKQQSPLITKLLEITVIEFETQYKNHLDGLLKPKIFLPFNQVIERNFEFSLTPAMPPIIL